MGKGNPRWIPPANLARPLWWTSGWQVQGALGVSPFDEVSQAPGAGFTYDGPPRPNLFLGTGQVCFDHVVAGVPGGGKGGTQSSGWGQGGSPQECMGRWIMGVLFKAGVPNLGDITGNIWTALEEESRTPAPVPYHPPPAQESLHKRRHRAWKGYNKVVGEKQVYGRQGLGH